MLKVNRPYEVFVDTMTSLTVIMPDEYKKDRQPTFSFVATPNRLLTIVSTERIEKATKYMVELEQPWLFGETVWLQDDLGTQVDVQIGAVVRTQPFDEQWHAADKTFGVKVMGDVTIFTLWSPTATEVKVRLYSKGVREYSMKRGERGVYSLELAENLSGVLYTYLCKHNLVWYETVDPYATSTSLQNERGIIEDASTWTPPSKKTSITPSPIIYEANVRDFSIHPSSGVQHRATFKGMVESGTHHASCATGFDYVKQLGITHVELLPIHSFDGVDDRAPLASYNWGYNPLFFNAIKNAYGTNPANYQGTKQEFAHLVEEMHAHDLGVILDVVYNHVYIREDSAFEKVVPGYYFRHDINGTPSNGTGVGNDMATERRMVRQFILQSISYWYETFHIDGFRFDLLGILDITTTKDIIAWRDKEAPSLLLLGEGWDLPTELPQEQKTTTDRADDLPGMYFFHDQFRDAIKGNTFDAHSKGLALGHVDSLEMIYHHFLRKDGYLKPHQAITYVECHDNYTLWDKLTLADEGLAEEERKIRHLLATVMVVFSNGIPFLHAGQEYFRTKNGVENSYRSSDEVNAMNWEEAARHRQYVDYVKRAIAIRKEFHHLWQPTTPVLPKGVHREEQWFSFAYGEELLESLHFFCSIGSNSSLPELPEDATLLFSLPTMENRAGKLHNTNGPQFLVWKKESSSL